MNYIKDVMDVILDFNLGILILITMVWTTALILDIKVKASWKLILIDIFIILSIPIYEHLYLKISLLDVMTINSIVFSLTFIVGYKVLEVSSKGKTLEEVEAEIAEIERKNLS